MSNGNGHGHHTNDDDIALPMSIGQFVSYIERRLSIEDSIEVLGREQTRLRVRAEGAERTIDLIDFFNAYTRNPALLDTLVNNFISVAHGRTPGRSTADYDRLATTIYPMLKPIELLVTVRERELPMLAYREFLADLIITYVIDEGRSVAYINEDHLERWGVDIHTIHQQAIVNLRRRTQEQVEFVTTGEGEQRIFIFNSGDGYDASRLLLPELLATWAATLPGNLVIGIPNRDFLIGFSDANNEILEGIAQQIQADSVAREHGITDQLFTLKAGEIREYEWE
jgi:uncharacterized protein YtpQ (UPF0354 family)